MTGRCIQQYEILKKLGSGGMGHVYKARDTRLNRIVAIKALAFGKLADDDQRQRFAREARVTSALDHPNIIAVHETLSVDGAEFLVMEYVEGKTLAELIPKSGMAVRDVLDYGAQMASALAAAHEAGVVHRDLKPGNIMVSETGTVKVLDFGLAKRIDSSEQRTALTAEGAILGTAAYMSPEQAEGKKADSRSDIFSFGAILHEMITGRRAFSGESHASLIAATRRDLPRRASDIVTGVPAGFDELLAKCLDKDPAARWRSAEDLHAALVALKSPKEAGTAADAAPLPSRTPNRTLALIVAVLLTALVAAGIWWLLSRKPEPRVDPIMIPPVSRETDRPSPVAPLQPAPAVPGEARVSRPPEVKPVILPDGYPIPLLLETPVTKDLAEGTSLRLSAATDIAIDGARLVAKGAVASGFVGRAEKRFLGGRRVMIGFHAVRAVDGRPVRLRVAAEAGKQTLREASVPGSKRDGSTVAVSGTSYVSHVDGAVEIVPAR